MKNSVDLTGQRIGRLVVKRFVQRLGRETFWECECDCGTHVTERKSRLRSSNPDRHIEACPACRATPCVVCGSPVIPQRQARKTCSIACSSMLKKQTREDHYKRLISGNPDFYVDRSAVRRARMQSDPGYADHVRRIRRRSDKKRREEIRIDPATYLEYKNLKREYYENNKSKILEAKRQKKISLTSDELDKLNDKKREYDQFRHSNLKNDANEYQRWLDYIADKRRERSLREFIFIGNELVKRFEEPE